MPGRRVSKTEHRIDGSVYIDRPMRPASAPQTTRLADAQKAESAKILEWKRNR